MTTRAVVVGSAGFVGRRLCASMLALGWDVTGVGLPGQRMCDGVTPAFGDAADAEFLGSVLLRAEPRYVVHLAAQSSVAAATIGNGAAATVRDNVAMSASVLDAASALPGVRVLLIGSAEEYGAHAPEDGPIGEDAALRPLNAYATSKVCQEILAEQYARSAGMDIVRTRSFNHTGPGQAQRFLVPSLVARARALRATGDVLPIGNGSVVRDFLHVDDVVDAYLALLLRGTSGSVYNVCSGIPISVEEIAALVLVALGAHAEIVSDPALVRTVDAPYLVGRNERVRRDTGWAPRRTLEEAIEGVVSEGTTHAAGV